MVSWSTEYLRRALKPLPGYTHVRNCYRVWIRVKYWVSSPLHWYWCACQGVKWRYGWTLHGRPIFRVHPVNARIRIGERFHAHSRSQGNAIGVFQPVIISAWAPGAQIEIADDVGMSGCSVTAEQHITIGKRVTIGAGVLIMDTDAHPLDPEQRFRGVPARTAPVVIEEDVFVGARAIILKGVRVGKGAVVAAGAVVTKEVPCYTIVGGNPARQIGTIPTAN